MGGVVEVPAPLTARNATGKYEGRASNELRTTMEVMEVGTEAMSEG